MIESDIQRLIQADATARGRKTCGLCGLPRDGAHVSYCKSCYNTYKRGWYLKHRSKEISRCAAWNKKNKRRVADNMKACRGRRPEHFREYNKNWNDKNRERVIENQRNRYKRNPEHFRKIKREKRLNNPEQARIDDRNRHHRRNSFLKKGTVTAAEWKEIVDRHFGRCFYCKTDKEKMTMDHFIPLSKGGRHHAENIVPACNQCNCRKHDSMPKDFIERIKNGK